MQANKNKQPPYTERLCFLYVSLCVSFWSPFVYPCPLGLFWIYFFFCMALLQYIYLSHNAQCWLSRERHKPRRLLVTAYFQVPECTARRRLARGYQARMPTKSNTICSRLLVASVFNWRTMPQTLISTAGSNSDETSKTGLGFRARQQQTPSFLLQRSSCNVLVVAIVIVVADHAAHWVWFMYLGSGFWRSWSVEGVSLDRDEWPRLFQQGVGP